MRKKQRIEVPSCGHCEKRVDNKLFCDLSDADLKKLSEKRAENFYMKGSVIFKEGSNSKGLFCVYEGKVKIFILGENGKEQILRFVKEGEVLGYRSLLVDEPYNTTASTIEDSIVCFIPKNRFIEILGNDEALSLQTIRLLAHNLKEVEEKVIINSQKHASEKITRGLLLLKKKFGLKEDKKTLNVSLMRSEIADFTGLTTETAIRTLSELNKRNVIKLRGKNIELINLDELVKLSGLID